MGLLARSKTEQQVRNDMVDCAVARCVNSSKPNVTDCRESTVTLKLFTVSRFFMSLRQRADILVRASVCGWNYVCELSVFSLG